MGTIGALAYRARAFLLLSCDAALADPVWQRLPAGSGQWPAAGLLAADRGACAGAGQAGLVVAAIGEDAGLEALQRAVPRILTEAASLAEAVSLAERLATAATSGCLGLADATGVALVEVVDGESRVEVTENGFLARSCPGLDEAMEEGNALGEIRGERMTAFLEGLYAWLPALDEDDVAARCRAVLRQEPILNPRTRASLYADLADGRVDLAIGDGPWQVERFGTRG
jgi:hypothetical protein